MRWLLAVDLTSNPEAIIDMAKDWASRCAAVLDLVHVDEMPSAAGFVRDPALRAAILDEQEGLHADRRDKTIKLLERLPEELRGEVSCVYGRAADIILSRASGYDAVLVATHGRKGLHRLWLGSVAEEVVRFATVPVLVLRLSDKA